jgi:FkbM family methyltransferase
MMKLNQIKVLRRLIIPLMHRLHVGDITIQHHWTHDKLTLHFFKHREYWYQGKDRKDATMTLLPALIRKGDYVIEIGGHIGYISLYLAHLVGLQGRVTVFEPGPDNLPYLHKNTAADPRLSVVEQAVTDYVGTARLYIDQLSGQNSSLIADYKILKANQEHAYLGSDVPSFVEVSCTTLDDFLNQVPEMAPAFIKIDVEGAELQVLKGMSETLKTPHLALMVEVHENAAAVFALLRDCGFLMFDSHQQPITTAQSVTGNIFCLKGDDDRLEVFSPRPQLRPQG